MQIQIQFISANVEDKGRYKQAEIAYKDVAKNQVTSKKIMSFNNPNVYKTLVDAKNGELYTIEMQKNDKGYWDWTAVTTGQTKEAGTTATGAKTFASPKSSYETPEERAQRQVYIVRQSSLASATELLVATKKNATKEDVVEVAKFYEEYVFGTTSSRTIPLADLPPIDTDEDIPV